MPTHWIAEKFTPSWEERHAPVCARHNVQAYHCPFCMEEEVRTLTLETLRMQLTAYKYKLLSGPLNEREHRLADTIFKELSSIIEEALPKT